MGIYLISLILIFLINKMGIITVSISEGCEVQRYDAFKVVSSEHLVKVTHFNALLWFTTITFDLHNSKISLGYI